MQYILSEEEYKDLQRRATLINISPAQLQNLCTKIANEMPIIHNRSKIHSPEPWRCMLTEPDGWCCNQCPVKTICPHDDKSWSK